MDVCGQRPTMGPELHFRLPFLPGDRTRNTKNLVPTGQMRPDRTTLREAVLKSNRRGLWSGALCCYAGKERHGTSASIRG